MKSATLLCILFLFIPASPYLGSWGYPILLTAMIISGFCRAYNFMPMLVVNSEFDVGGQDFFKVKLWQTLIFYGEIISFIASGLMMNSFHWNWKICALVNIGCFFIIALGMYLTADEIDMSKRNTREDGSEPSFFESVIELK